MNPRTSNGFEIERYFAIIIGSFWCCDSSRANRIQKKRNNWEIEECGIEFHGKEEKNKPTTKKKNRQQQRLRLGAKENSRD